MKVLVGTYREENSQWIQSQKLYNLPLAVGCNPSEYLCFEYIVLYLGNATPLAYRARYVSTINACGLKDIGYSLSNNSHDDEYALFVLLDKVVPAEILSSPEADICVCSTRYTGRIDDEFYSKPLPKVGGKSIPNVFDKLRPYFKKWNSGIALNPLQSDFFSLLGMAAVPFPSPSQGKFTFIDLFAGIGGIRLGYQQLGGKCVFSSEWDEWAAKTYEANFGEKPYGDITKIDPASIPDFDILLGGFPCQPFSIIGDKEGFGHETQGTLFFNIESILLTKKPKAFMLENVRNLTAHDNGRTFKVIKEHLEAAGYDVHAKVLNALDYGVPQKRERIIICGFRKKVDFEFPPPIPVEERKTVADIIDPAADNDKSLFVKPAIRESRLQRLKDKNFPKPYISHENVAGSITPHNFSCALRAGASANYILINDERRPSPREMLRIQGFPDSFKIVVNYAQIKHQCGNRVAVPVISAVAKRVVEQLEFV